VCTPVKPGSEVAEEVLHRHGRYRQVAPNLRVKQVVIGQGERRGRNAGCFNPEEAQRQKAHRDRVLAELEAELASLATFDPGKGHSKRQCQLRASERYGRYLSVGVDGKLFINRMAIQRVERLDRKLVVHSNDDTLPAEEMALGYKQLVEVERAWWMLKSGLRVRPVFHWRPHRIGAHVSLVMRSPLLRRILESRCRDTWRSIQAELQRIQLARLSTPHGEVWQVTEGTLEARNSLKQLGITPPPPVRDVVLRPSDTPERLSYRRVRT